MNRTISLALRGTFSGVPAQQPSASLVATMRRPNKYMILSCSLCSSILLTSVGIASRPFKTWLVIGTDATTLTITEQSGVISHASVTPRYINTDVADTIDMANRSCPLSMSLGLEGFLVGANEPLSLYVSATRVDFTSAQVAMSACLSTLLVQ